MSSTSTPTFRHPSGLDAREPPKTMDPGRCTCPPIMAVADIIVFGRKSFPDSAAYWTAADGELAAWMNPAIVGRGGSTFSDAVERRALTLREVLPVRHHRRDLLDLMPVLGLPSEPSRSWNAGGYGGGDQAGGGADEKGWCGAELVHRRSEQGEPNRRQTVRNQEIH